MDGPSAGGFPAPAARKSAASAEMQLALKVMLYILVGAVSFLTVFVAYLYIFFLPPAPEINTYEFTDADFATVFSDPIPTFNISDSDFAITDRTSEDMEIGIEDDIIYRFVYISNDGISWKRVTLMPAEGTGADIDDMWISKNASYEYIIESGDFNITHYPYTATGYITLFSCTRNVIGQWDCHDGWQMEQFNTVILREGTGGAGGSDECGGCAEGFVCVQKQCVTDESSRNTMRVGAGESLSVVVKGVEYLLTVTSISGDGVTAKVSINGQEYTVDKSTGDVYIVKDELRLVVNMIQPFTSSTDGFLEIVMVGEYDSMNLCENCVYKPPAGSSGGGGGGGGGSSSCRPKTCADYGYECGTRSDGCTGTLSCGSCDTAGGYACTAGKCVKEVCTPDCTDASTRCTGITFSDGCNGTCTGTLLPDCSGRECGLSPNACGWCNTTSTYCTDTYGSGYTCQSDGNCGPGPCVPNCTGRECGSNGCGGICGNCSTWATFGHEYFTCNATNYLCDVHCGTGWDNCDSNRMNGCEGNLTTNQYCGSCTMTCTPSQYCVDCTGISTGQCAGHSGLSCLYESPFQLPPVLPNPPP